MIKIGDRLPEAEFITMTADGTQKFTTGTVFSGRKVVLFAVPGAFTPTCSMNHLPGFVKETDAIKAKGADTIACTAVNDVHVMNAWGRHSGADGKVLMLADGSGDFTKAMDLVMDGSGFGLGMRSKRYAAVLDDGVIQSLDIDEGGVSASACEAVLEKV